MNTAEKLYLRLREKYGSTLPFKRICQDENIAVAKGDLGEGVFGMYLSVKGRKILLLNSKISKDERRDWAWHELYHHFFDGVVDAHVATREESKATLFAALCRIPKVEWNDTIEAVVERFGVSPWLAKARIQCEVKKLHSD